MTHLSKWIGISWAISHIGYNSVSILGRNGSPLIEDTVTNFKGGLKVLLRYKRLITPYCFMWMKLPLHALISKLVLLILVIIRGPWNGFPCSHNRDAGYPYTFLWSHSNIIIRQIQAAVSKLKCHLTSEGISTAPFEIPHKNILPIYWKTCISYRGEILKEL